MREDEVARKDGDPDGGDVRLFEKTSPRGEARYRFAFEGDGLSLRH